jgi:Carboxypeptidase regulatory-like domain/TonB-dependent Receptor Plug Domain
MSSVPISQPVSGPRASDLKRASLLDLRGNGSAHPWAGGSSLLRIFLAALVILCSPLTMLGQTTSGSMSGIIVDADGARIVGATLELRNTKTHDSRHAKTNNAGVFEFELIPAGTYTLTVTMKGFETLVTKDIEVHPNDQVNLTQLRMEVGSQEISVTVEADTEISTSGERSSLITAKDIQKLSTVGRDVSELLKTQPGFSLLQSGLDNSAASSAEVAGTYSGLTNYVGNGATANGTALVSDGANLTNPVSGNGQIQTVNMDFVQEVKIETSNFGADTAHGPTVITAVGKSGGSSFHGNVRAIGRTYQLNGQDWFQKFQGFGQIKDHYFYPGVEIGGPVIFPHSKFNQGRKITFEAGAEDYVQRNVYAYGSLPKSLLAGLVPTQAMIQGNFQESDDAHNTLGNYLGVSYEDIIGQGNYGNGCTASGRLSQYLHICAQPGVGPATGTNHFQNGLLQNGINGIDPGARAILRAYYEPNCTNTDLSSCAGPGPTINFYNTQTLNLENPDSYQMHARIDNSISDNDKISLNYNGQFGLTTRIPEQIYYSPGTSGQAILGGADTPGKINADTSSNSGSVNYTHIFSAKMTNEVFAGLAQNFQTFTSGNAALQSKSYWGYPYSGLFPKATTQLPQVATYSTTGAAILPFAITPDFSNGPFVAKAFLPTGGDNFSYLFKSHTFKLGVYLERDTGNQTDLSPDTNGQISDYYLPGVTGCGFSGCGENYLADFFEGYIGSFSQQNFNAQTNLYFWTASWFATDSYKLNKRITIDYGVRFDHLGPWQDKHGIGMATFYPNLYKTDGVPVTNPDGSAFLPGVRWHGGNRATNANAGYSNVPLSGTPARWAFVSPRVGVAFDAYGNGSSIFRGGWGMYRAHDSVNDYTGPAQTAQGVVNVSAGGLGGAFPLSSLNNTETLACNTNTQTLCPSILALDPTDNEQPLTETYSFSVSQRMPFSSVFDIAYVGNQSTHLLTDNPSQNVVQSEDLRDINPIPIGAFFKPDPNPASPYFGQSYSPYAPPNSASLSQEIQNDYRQYPEYTHIGIPRHITYANYNALQVTFNRQKGQLNYGLNYTWSKAQGVRGAFNNGTAGDPTNLRANYGPLAFDRTHIIAASYSYDEGKRFHFVHSFVNGFSNDWFISGITNLQSGPNLQSVYYPNFLLQGFATSSYSGNTCTAGTAAGQTQACTIDNVHLLGTPDVMLQPVLRSSNNCPSGNPGTGLHLHQYINGYCFALPAYGVNGQTNLGYLRGPAFFNSDLTLRKTIPFKDARNMQIQFAGFNFLNHPLPSFSSRFPNEANLRFYDPNFAGFAGVQLANGTATNGTCSSAGSQCFGYAGYKTGRRVMEVSLRYNF